MQSTPLALQHQNLQITYDAQQTRLKEEMAVGKHSIQQAQRIFDTYKRQGDTAFKAVRYEEAIHAYTMALIVRPDPVTFANRSLAHFKCESYGSALEDGRSSVQLDPQYTKGFYRIGVCEFAMHNYERAMEAFTKVLSLSPSEMGARQQLAAARKAWREQQFAQAVSDDGESSPSSAPMSVNGFFPMGKGAGAKHMAFFDKLNWNLKVDPCWRHPAPDLSIDYLQDGVHTDGKVPLQIEAPNSKRRLTSRKYTREFVHQTMEWFAADRSKEYPKIFVYHILKDFTELIRSMPTVVDYKVPTLDDIDCTQEQAKRYMEGVWSDMEGDEEDDDDDDDDEKSEDNDEKNKKDGGEAGDDKSPKKEGEGSTDSDKSTTDPEVASQTESPTQTDPTTRKDSEMDSDENPAADAKGGKGENGEVAVTGKDDSSMRDVPTPTPIPTMCDSTPPPVHGSGDEDAEPLLEDEDDTAKTDEKKESEDEANKTLETNTTTKKTKKIAKKARPDPLYSVYQVGKLNVCGDTHGQFWDLLNIFKLLGNPGPLNPYLFNGDYVDRGSFGYELVLTLMLWKLHCPIALHMTRGNHETINMNRSFGFYGEVVHKADERIFECFTQAFNVLPLAYVLGNRVLILHGGLFSDENATLNDLRSIDRFRQPPEQGGLMVDCLWSDPHPFFKGRRPSVRGAGCQFGSDITKQWLLRNNLELVVRSHEMKHQGYEVAHEGKLVTIFSAPNYCLAEGSTVTLLNGTAKQIQTFSQSTPTALLSYSQQTNKTTIQDTMDWLRLDQGIKDVVRVTLADGQSTTCTPDHTFLVTNPTTHPSSSDLDTIDTTCKRADELTPGMDWVVGSVMGVDTTMDFDLLKHQDHADEDFTITIHSTQYNSRHVHDREPIYAFCRLLGLVYAQLNTTAPTAANQSALFLIAKSIFDAESIIADLQTAFSLESRPSYEELNGEFVIRTEMNFFTQTPIASNLPAFLLESTTPKPFVREFIASYLAQVSITPQYDAESESFTPFQGQVKIASTAITALLEILELNHLTTQTQHNTLTFSTANHSALEHYYTTVGFRYSAKKLSDMATAVTWGRVAHHQQLTNNATPLTLSHFMSTVRPHPQSGFASWSLPVDGVVDCHGAMETFDLTVTNSHLFVANGMVVHNCDSMGNKGAVMTFDHKYGYTFTQFEAVHHPPVRAMFYADPYLR